MDRYPRAAAGTCQKLSNLNRDYHRKDADDAYKNISLRYEEISTYLLKLAKGEDFDFSLLTDANEDVQILEQYLSMTGKMVLSLSSPDSSSYPSYLPHAPVESQSLGYPVQPSSLPSGDSSRLGAFPAPGGATSPAFSYSSAPSSFARPSAASSAYPSGASPFSPSYGTQGGQSLGYPAQPSSTPGHFRVPGVASSAYPSAPSSSASSPWHFSYPAPAPVESPLKQSSSVAASAPAPVAYPPYVPLAPFESPSSLGYPQRSSFEPFVTLTRAYAPPAPVKSPPALESAKILPARPIGPLQQSRLNQEQKAPAAAKGVQLPLKPLQIVAPPPIQWISLSEAQKQVAFFIGGTLTALRQKLSSADRRNDPIEPDHVLDPNELRSFLDQKDRELEGVLTAAPSTRESVLSNYSKNITALKESLGEFSKILGPLQTKVQRLKRLLQTAGCGEDISQNQEYKDLVQNLQDPLRRAHVQLSQKISELFPADIWELRATIFPGLQRPGDETVRPKAVPQAVAVKIEKISDSLDKGVREIVTKLNGDIQVQIEKGGRQRGYQDESIMNLGSGGVACMMFDQIDQSIGDIQRHFGLLPMPLMTVKDLVQWKTELTEQFPGVEVKGLTAAKIRATFKNLTDHFSQPYPYVDRRVPPAEYLKALTFFKTVLERFKGHEDIAVLVSTVLTGLDQQGLNCGAGAFGRSILLYNATLQFLMNLEKTA